MPVIGHLQAGIHSQFENESRVEITVVAGGEVIANVIGIPMVRIGVRKFRAGAFGISRGVWGSRLGWPDCIKGKVLAGKGVRVGLGKKVG